MSGWMNVVVEKIGVVVERSTGSGMRLMPGMDGTSGHAALPKRLRTDLIVHL
ncbi:MAG: hypothetical protein R2855_04760 [Thermomicrobiales bacterium]